METKTALAALNNFCALRHIHLMPSAFAFNVMDISAALRFVTQNVLRVADVPPPPPVIRRSLENIVLQVFRRVVAPLNNLDGIRVAEITRVVATKLWTVITKHRAESNVQRRNSMLGGMCSDQPFAENLADVADRIGSHRVKVRQSGIHLRDRIILPRCDIGLRRL